MKLSKTALTFTAVVFLAGVGATLKAHDIIHDVKINDYRAELVRKDEALFKQNQFKIEPLDYKNDLVEAIPSEVSKQERKELLLMVDSVSSHYQEEWAGTQK